MDQMLISTIPLDVLEAKIQSIIARALKERAILDLEEKLLSPSETCKLFQPNISKVTLHKWTKDGHIQEHRIGSRVYYKYSEVIESFKILKKYKRQYG